MSDEFDLSALIQTFVSECEDNLATMEAALLTLETQPEDRPSLDTVFRMAHSIKGDAGCVGFSAVADFAHVVEDLLDRIRQHAVTPAPGVVTTMLHAVDRLRELVQLGAMGRHELERDDQTVLDAIRSLTSGDASPAENPASPAAAAQTAAKGERRPVRTLRVDSARLDEMLDLTGEIAIARGRLRQILESMGGATAAAALESFQDAERMFLDLQELVMRVRMVPVGPYFRQQARVVRDLAASEGKSAVLVVEGADAEIDNTLLDEMRQPLTHMLRNAIHHGIETPEERRAAGKDPCGRVTLRAYQEAGMIVIEVADDGRGVNRELLVRRAAEAGVVIDPQKVDDHEVLDLIFEPGVTTASQITEMSGRGVGMDVVRRNVDLLHGSVRVTSTPGMGTTLTVRLPLTLAIIDGFCVSVGGERYIIPHEFILECVELPDVTRNGATGVIDLRDRALPFVRLASLFEVARGGRTRENVVVVECNGMRAGLAVDVLHGHMQIVIKPLSKLFRSLPMVAGSAILGDGSVALILDVPSLIREVLQQERAA